MKKKLTLRLDADRIQFAKKHAKKHGQSVSKLVENYFAALEGQANGSSAEKNVEDDLGPITRSLGGVASGSELTEEDYYHYLEEKHR